MQELYIGIDGGGTKTNAICADAQGAVVGEGNSGPTSLTATSVGAASFNLRESVRQSLEQIEGEYTIKRMVMGLAGMDTPSEHQKAKGVFTRVLEDFQVEEFLLVNDIVIALASGTDEKNAVALISGTGSNCYGTNDVGHEAKTGGMDFLLTDQGSGYEIGRYVLRTAVKSYDGRIEKSILEELVCQHFQIPSVAELKSVVYNPLLSKTEVAELSKVCAVAFDKGDHIAIQIYDHVVEELFMMASTVLYRLGLPGKQADLVLAGSISKIPYIQQKLYEQLKSVCPGLKLVTDQQDPVYGALKLSLNGEVHGGVRALPGHQLTSNGQSVEAERTAEQQAQNNHLPQSSQSSLKTEPTQLSSQSQKIPGEKVNTQPTVTASAQDQQTPQSPVQPSAQPSHQQKKPELNQRQNATQNTASSSATSSTTTSPAEPSRPYQLPNGQQRTNHLPVQSETGNSNPASSQS